MYTYKFVHISGPNLIFVRTSVSMSLDFGNNDTYFPSLPRHMRDEVKAAHHPRYATPHHTTCPPITVH